MYQTMTMLMFTGSVKAKDATSSLTLVVVLMTSSLSSALETHKVAQIRAVEEVIAKLMSDLMDASLSILLLTMIAKILVLLVMDDYLLSKPLEEMLVASVSVELSLEQQKQKAL